MGSGCTEAQETYSYDGLSRLTSSTTPEEGPSSSASGTTSYYFTASGGGLCSGNPQAVCQRTDARSITTTYAYDAENRLTSKTYSDSTPTVTYYYDQASYNGLTISNGKGRRTGMSDASGQAAWSYDKVGGVLTVQRTLAGITKTISYTYNVDETVSAMTYPSGYGLSYTYDTAGRPASATGSNTTYVSSDTYAPQGALASGYLNGLYTTWSYDQRLRLSGLNVGSGAKANYAFYYLGNGNGRQIENLLYTGRTENIAYDHLNRLTSAYSQATSGADCWGQTVPSTGYDRYGNLMTINSSQCSSPTLSLTVSAKNRIANSGYTYDNSGNLTADGTYTYTWDAESHLKSVNGVNYTYDGDLRRVEKSSGTLYWYSPSGQILEETDLSGNLDNDYVYFGGKRLARSDSSGNAFVYFADPLGTTRLITENGSVCYDADYLPFGGERVFTNTCAQNYKFTGLERDSESGLDNTLYRKYSSGTGRWLSPDPKRGCGMNPQGLNRYPYVTNNPATLTDPNGDLLPACDPACEDPDFNFENPDVCPSWCPPGAPVGEGGGEGEGPKQVNVTVTCALTSGPVLIKGTCYYGASCPVPGTYFVVAVVEIKLQDISDTCGMPGLQKCPPKVAVRYTETWRVYPPRPQFVSSEAAVDCKKIPY